MTEERWKNLIEVQPDSHVVKRHAEIARRKALSRFDRPAANGRMRWLLAPGLALAAIVLTIGEFRQTPDAPAPQAPIITQERTRMQFVLSDGTRVYWVFDDRFGL